MDGTDTDTDLTRVVDIRITPSASNNTTYTVTLNSTDYTYLSDASATVAEITAGLTAAIPSATYTVTDNNTSLDVTRIDAARFTVVLDDDDTGSLMTFANLDTGNEVEINVGGVRNATLSINVFCKDDGPAAGARRYMSAIEASAQMDVEIEARKAAGWGWLGNSAPQDLNELAGVGFRSRQQMDVFVNLPSNLIDYRGYIKTVKISSTDLGWTDLEFGDT
jgi:hypothetical protein